MLLGLLAIRTSHTHTSQNGGHLFGLCHVMLKRDGQIAVVFCRLNGLKAGGHKRNPAVGRVGLPIETVVVLTAN